METARKRRRTEPLPPLHEQRDLKNRVRRLDRSPGVLTYFRPRCPHCRSAKLRTLRSVADQGDGSTYRRARCGGCGLHFAYVLE